MLDNGKILDIINGKIESRIKSFVYLKNIEEKLDIETIENIEYFDFEENSYNFFKDYNLTLNVFDRGKFFEYIKDIAMDNNKTLVVDNLEIIQNILFKKNEFREFFKEMELQKFRGKIIFVLTDIRVMKILKLLKENYLDKNIIIGV